MNRRTVIIAFTLLFASIASTSLVSALEIESETYELEVHERIGRFSLYAKTDDGPVPMFVADDPTTSYISILSQNRIYRLGDSFEFRQNAQLTETGARMTWTSSRLSIEVDIDIESFSYALLEMTVTNTSETDLEVGVRMLIDTYLGEDGTHFATPDTTVNGEREFAAAPLFIQSGPDSTPSLYLWFGTAGATSPNRVILANWKRLDDTSWSYTVNTNRNFNVLPYSINDSAVSLYYNPETLARGDSRYIRVIFATDEPIQRVGAPASRTTSTSTTTTTVPADTDTNASAAHIREQLRTIETLLDSIDRILSSGREPTDAEIQEIRDAIREVEERRSGSE